MVRVGYLYNELMEEVWVDAYDYNEFKEAYDSKVKILEEIIKDYDKGNDCVFIAGGVASICKSMRTMYYKRAVIETTFNVNEIDAIVIAVFQKDGIPSVDEIIETCINAKNHYSVPPRAYVEMHWDVMKKER